jgi:hypothetical protein
MVGSGGPRCHCVLPTIGPLPAPLPGDKEGRTDIPPLPKSRPRLNVTFNNSHVLLTRNTFLGIVPNVRVGRENLSKEK